LAKKSALKRLRQSEKHRLRNKAAKSEVKTYGKKVLAAVAANNKEDATSQLRKVSSLYDKAVSNGAIKQNTASRSKSRLAAKVNRIS